MNISKAIWRKLIRFYYSKLPLENVFYNKYYNPKFSWCKDNQGTTCVGSDDNTTKVLRSKLPYLIKKHKIKSIIDAGCGNFFWLRKLNLEKIDYFGIDIVKKIIEHNDKIYKKKNIKFLIADLTKYAFPKADLIICRDVLTRSSLKNNLFIINNIKKSESKYLLTTFFPSTKKNYDIINGEFSRINLLLNPYNFRKPIFYIKEKDKLNKYIGLWKISEIN